jgi:hypothetical protein
MENKNLDELFEKELRLEKELEKAIDYCLLYASLDELKEHFEWYNADNLYHLKASMYESYLGNYDLDELEDRIKDLYK